LAAIALIIAAKILKIQFPKSKIIILAFIFIGPDYFLYSNCTKALYKNVGSSINVASPNYQLRCEDKLVRLQVDL
jgi:hypothetical protein